MSNPAGRASQHPYDGRVAVLATKHAKLPLIGPPLARFVGLAVEEAPVDTDILGTFSGEVPRPGPPLETAVSKARLGMRATGHVLGLASEGSIGPDPAIPFVTADREIVVLVDDDAGLVIWEAHTSYDIVTATTTARPGEDLTRFLSQAGFPAHRLIVRPNQGPVRPVRKGIDDLTALTVAIAEIAATSPDGRARVETDLRSHACPSRQPVIAGAAERLAQRVASRCPSCGAPGWGRIDVVVGIPCSWCGGEIASPRAELDGCPSCDRRDLRDLLPPGATGDPANCPACNP
ncbi:MAG: DUF6671 family protein [Acidimicrobiales bacterium]